MTVIVIVPIVLNSLQFIVQDMFLKKSDFEITDMDVLKKFYCSNDNEDLDVSLTKDKENTVELEIETAAPSSVRPVNEKVAVNIDEEAKHDN